MQSITWNIDIHLPQPFSRMANLMSLFSFDFLSPDCVSGPVSGSANHYKSVYIWSFGPVVLSLLNLAL